MNRIVSRPWGDGTIRRFHLRNIARRGYESSKPQLKSRQGTQSASSEASPKETPIDIPSPGPAWHKRLGPVTSFFGWFDRTQARRPLTVQFLTTTTIYLLGDLLAQDIGGEPYNPLRTLRNVTIGAVAAIPGYKWFIFLGNNFNVPNSPWTSVLIKAAVQQAFFAPTFNSYFFGMQAYLSGESPSGVIQRIKETVPTSVINSCKIWPLFTVLTFRFVPAPYRFMFSGVLAVFWQGYLSWLNRSAERGDEIKT